MRRTTKHAFAVIRLDKFLVGSGPLSSAITVKEVVLTKEEAEAEVRRLSAVNREKDCQYFWQITRLVEVPIEAAGKGPG